MPNLYHLHPFYHLLSVVTTMTISLAYLKIKGKRSKSIKLAFIQYADVSQFKEFSPCKVFLADLNKNNKGNRSSSPNTKVLNSRRHQLK